MDDAEQYSSQSMYAAAVVAVVDVVAVAVVAAAVVDVVAVAVVAAAAAP